MVYKPTYNWGGTTLLGMVWIKSVDIAQYKEHQKNCDGKRNYFFAKIYDQFSTGPLLPHL